MAGVAAEAVMESRGSVGERAGERAGWTATRRPSAFFVDASVRAAAALGPL